MTADLFYHFLSFAAEETTKQMHVDTEVGTVPPSLFELISAYFLSRSGASGRCSACYSVASDFVCDLFSII